MTEKLGLYSRIFALCEEGETGTLYITTVDNRGCYIVIVKGKITAMSLGRTLGDDLVQQLVTLKIKSYSFKNNLIMPMPISANITSNYDVLDELGYLMYKKDFSDDGGFESLPNEKVSALMYRGQAVAV